MSLDDRRAALKRELAAGLRELNGLLAKTAAAEAELAELLPAVQQAVGRFAAAGSEPPPADGASRMAGMHDFHERGSLTGLSNPVAPPLSFWTDAAAGVVRGGGRFGAAYEGAPGVVHGGFVAAALDELLGYATTLSGGPGMTGELTVRFLRPTPIGVELEMTARFERREGRKLHLSGEMLANGERTAEARGLFIAVDGAKFQELDEKRRLSS